MTSRADHIRTQLQQASGDMRATWRTAQSLLHSRQKVMRGPRRKVQFVFSSTKSDASGTTSRRPYSSPAPGVCCTTAYRTRIIGFPDRPQVRSVWHCAFLDSVLSAGQDTVREARAASLFCNQRGSRSTPVIGTRSAAVCRVLQSTH